jgi:asparagine synthase (glutamine-hydrolysing)
MCGIAGIVEREPGGRAGLEPAIRRMVASLGHRGPDGAGQNVDAERGVALGHTRLAIIDLSDGGRQPMQSADGQMSLVYNGEIYNFRALRAALEAEGRTFASQSDSEVLLALYEARGPAFVKDLEGIFAFAILDRRARRLCLARDPLGIKPLYYARRGSSFVFGSEIKALLASGRVPREPDWQAIADYFAFLYVPCPATAFAHVRQLPPAHTLTIDLDGGGAGDARPVRYWSVRRLPEVERAGFDEAKELLRAQLEPVVRDQLVSDVPIGVFLSAGVDSTAIAGLAARARPVDTYTVVFDDPALAFYDEREGARAIARHIGARHHELPIRDIDPFDLLDTLSFFDEPFGNPTSHLVYLLSREARRSITVALCGAGGDELFAGYPRYRAERLASALRVVPPGLMRAAGRALGHLKDSHRTMHLRRVKELFQGWDGDPVERFVNWTYFMNGDETRELLEGRGAEPPSRVVRRLVEESPLPDVESRLLHADAQSFLLDNLLAYTDRAGMAVGLEIRVPLLDHRFVETALNVAFRHKLRGRTTKAVFRAAFDDFFPGEAKRLPKRGFNVPLAPWMRALDAYFERAGHVRDRFGDSVGATWRDGVLDAAVIDRLRAEHRTGAADRSSELFAIMMFDRWFGTYIAGTAATTEPRAKSHGKNDGLQS